MAIAGLTLAIVAIVLSFIPCISLFAVLPAVLGVIFSIVGLVQARTTKRHKWLALPGLVFSLAAMVWPLFFWFLLIGTVSAVNTTLTGLMEDATFDSWVDVSWTPPSATQPAPDLHPIPSTPGMPQGGSLTSPAAPSRGAPSQRAMARGGDLTDADSDARRAIKTEVDAVRAAVGREAAHTMWARVGALRDRVHALTFPGDLHYQLDLVIVAMLDAAAQEHYDRALRLFNAHDFHNALNACSRALALYGDDAQRPPIHEPARVRSSVHDQTLALHSQIQYWADPVVRIELRGFVGVNDESVANIYDRARGAFVRLRVNDVVDGFTVTEIDRHERAVVFEAGGVRTRIR